MVKLYGKNWIHPLQNRCMTKGTYNFSRTRDKQNDSCTEVEPILCHRRLAECSPNACLLHDDSVIRGRSRFSNAILSTPNHTHRCIHIPTITYTRKYLDLKNRDR